MRFAVIGTGAIVEKFISAGSQVPGFSLYAVYSRSKERGQAFAAEQAADKVARAADQRLAALVSRAEDRDALNFIVQP